jgi:hypothetical protein
MEPRALLGRDMPGEIPQSNASIIPLLTAYPNLPATSSDISPLSLNTTCLGHIADILTIDIDLRRCGGSLPSKTSLPETSEASLACTRPSVEKRRNLPSVVYNVAVEEVGDQTGFCSRVRPARPRPRPACPERAASCARSYKV